MFKSKKLFINSILISLVLNIANIEISLAATTPAPTTQQLAPTTPSAQTQKQIVSNNPQSQVLNCPIASALKFNSENQTWSSGKEWQGYEQSIVTEIQSFIGAQWTGVKIGKIICLYQGKNATDFPVSLEQRFIPEKGSTLILEPTSENWGAEVQGYRFCKSTNVMDCPFHNLPSEQTPTTKQLYDQIKYAPSKIQE
jgi:hypothetical protein